jgi:hypothetical protein
MAAEGIGSMFRGTLDPGILTALAKVALEDPEEYVRNSAYLGLLRVNGTSLAIARKRFSRHRCRKCPGRSAARSSYFEPHRFAKLSTQAQCRLFLITR